MLAIESTVSIVAPFSPFVVLNIMAIRLGCQQVPEMCTALSSRVKKVLAVSLLGLVGMSRGEPAASEQASLCFNDCSGHGTCRDSVCLCHMGWHGGDCRHAFAERIMPILSAGHFNITSRKAFLQLSAGQPAVLLGFSSPACHKCMAVESDYADLAAALMARFKMPMARVDVSKPELHSFAQDLGALEIPSLVLHRKGRGVVYNGVQTPAAVLEFVRKATAPVPLVPLHSVSEARAFLERNASSRFPQIGSAPVYATTVVGFFSDLDMEGDELKDYNEVATELQVRGDIYTGVVTDPAVCRYFKEELQWIDRTPSLLASRAGGPARPVSLNLDESMDEGESIKQWVFRSTLPLVGELNGGNFGAYEQLGLPMLITFLDLGDERPPGAALTADTDAPVPGKSGGLPNAGLVDELKAVAAEHVGRLSFVYADGVALEDHMLALGLHGGRERLPSIAFNLKDNRKIPFPEDLPINHETLAQFCADFLSGRLQSADDAKQAAQKALTSARPVSKVNTAKRKPPRQAPVEVPGVSESYDEMPATVVNSTSFDAIVLDEGKDVMLLFHSAICDQCATLAPYFRRVVERFADLNITSLVVARMDVTQDTPPIELRTMPTIVFFPAHNKAPPYRFYSGIGKPMPMMLWAQDTAAIPFSLPELPHLSEADRALYKRQVHERERQRRGLHSEL